MNIHEYFDLNNFENPLYFDLEHFDDSEEFNEISEEEVDNYKNYLMSAVFKNLQEGGKRKQQTFNRLKRNIEIIGNTLDNTPDKNCLKVITKQFENKKNEKVERKYGQALQNKNYILYINKYNGNLVYVKVDGDNITRLWGYDSIVGNQIFRDKSKPNINVCINNNKIIVSLTKDKDINTQEFMHDKIVIDEDGSVSGLPITQFKLSDIKRKGQYITSLDDKYKLVFNDNILVLVEKVDQKDVKDQKRNKNQIINRYKILKFDDKKTYTISIVNNKVEIIDIIDKKTVEPEPIKSTKPTKPTTSDTPVVPAIISTPTTGSTR